MTYMYTIRYLDPRVRYNSEEPHGLLGNDGTRTEEEDAVARRIIERSHSQRSETTRRHRNTYYYSTEHQEMRDHVIVNILPRLRTYATDAERSIIKHVPNALTVCSAISRRDLEVFDIVDGLFFCRFPTRIQLARTVGTTKFPSCIVHEHVWL